MPEKIDMMIEINAPLSFTSEIGIDAKLVAIERLASLPSENKFIY